MKRIGVVALTCCAVGGVCSGVAVAGSPPPPPKPPTPLSLTITKVHGSLRVVVKCKGVTKANANDKSQIGWVVLDVRTSSPKGEYGVQSNGPGMPVAVHPYAGKDGATSGPVTFTISIKHQTESFKFRLKAIKNPRRVKIRALTQGGGNTKFYSKRLR